MASSNIAKLQKAYPWIKTPLVCCAPMRMIALAPLTVEVSKAGKTSCFLWTLFPLASGESI